MCDHLTEADIDCYLDAGAPPEERARVEECLATCPTCRSRWKATVAVHGLLERTPAALPESLVTRTLTRVAGVTPTRQRRWPAALVRAAVVLLAFAGGLATATLTRATRATRAMTATDQPSYLFVLTGTNAPNMSTEALRDVASDFRSWTDSLQRLGQIEASGQLTDGAPWHVTGEAAPLDSSAVEALAAVSGYYVLHARDDNDAMVLARSCPFLRFGGSIVVRRRV